LTDNNCLELGARIISVIREVIGFLRRPEYPILRFSNWTDKHYIVLYICWL